MAKLRRLFNMKINHVSLVDKAANNRKFLIVKRDNEGGQENMEELEKVLGQVEDTINDLGDKVSAIEKKIDEREDKEFVFKFDIDKAGAKFSKVTRAALKSLRDTIDKLLGDDSANEGDDKAKVSKEEKEKLAKELADKMYDELEPKDDKKEDE